MQYRWLRFRLSPVAAAAAALILALPVWCSAAPLRRYNDDELAMISRLVARVLAPNHYRAHKLDAEMSRRLYDEYIKMLDPGKLYFTVGDLRPFEARRDTLCRDLAKGKADFAFELYALYVRRHREFREFAAGYLKKPIDFTVDEYCQTDRKKAEFPATDAERRELWRLRIKNDVLYFRLLERMMKQEAADPASGAKKKKKKNRDEDSPLWRSKTPEQRLLARLHDLGNAVEKRSRVDILGLYLDALAQSYGPHSSYMPPSENDDFDIRMGLSLIGIGATLTSEDGFIKVVDLVPGGPAARDGRLKVNDRIIAVAEEGADPVDIIDMPVAQAVRYIRGKEGSRVTLTVLPGDKGRNAAPVNIVIKRAKVQLVESAAKGKIEKVRTADGRECKVGIVTLPSFYFDLNALRQGDRNARRCSTDVRKILEDFKRDKVDAVVVDLRLNGGGSLPEAINTTGLFLTTAPVVQVRSRRRLDVQRDDDSDQAYSGPLVILTSKLSASSSEIFAAALRDNARAVLVGDSRTFGKGTVLEVHTLEDSLSFLGRKIPAGTLIYETAMFFRVTGGSPQQLGVASDIVIPSLTEEMKVGEMFFDNHLPWDSIDPAKNVNKCDPGLDRKIAVLRKRSAARVAASGEFRTIKQRSEFYRQYRDREKISLNEEKRWKEYREEEVLEKAMAKFNEESRSGDEDADAVLDEAVRIAADLAELK